MMDLLAAPQANEDICHESQEKSHSPLLSATHDQFSRVVHPSPPLLTLQPASSLHESYTTFLASSEVNNEIQEERGSSTLSSARDGRLTPLSLLESIHSPSGSVGNKSSLSYFSYLGENFTRSSASSPIINIGNGVILSCASSSFKGSIASNTEKYPEVFAHDDQTTTNQMIDYCSCMCCVKALFYHCNKGSEEEVDYEENLCSCENPGAGCVKRWGVLSLLTCCMPLLLFYAPLKGIQKATQKLKRRFGKTSVNYE